MRIEYLKFNLVVMNEDFVFQCGYVFSTLYYCSVLSALTFNLSCKASIAVWFLLYSFFTQNVAYCFYLVDVFMLTFNNLLYIRSDHD